MAYCEMQTNLEEEIMTYKELAAEINKLPPEQQEKEVIAVDDDDEFQSVLRVICFPNGVQPDHPYLVLD